MHRKRKSLAAFTLIELIIVVIVIGILATFAVPQYLKSVERTKGAKAKHNISLIAQAEKMYRADNDKYIETGDNPGTTDLNEYVELKDVDEDDDWVYDTAMGGTSGGSGDDNTFVIEAKRADGPHKNKKMTLNQDGVWNPDDDDDWPY